MTSFLGRGVKLAVVGLAVGVFSAGQLLAEEVKVLKVDTTQSHITWLGKKVLGQHDGRVKLADGSVSLDQDGKVVAGAFAIDMSSIENIDMKDSPKDQGKLEGHLKSPDFFNVEKFPTAQFKISSVKEGSEGASEIVGNLTVKGITVPVTIPAKIVEKDGVYTATAELSIDRTKWDIRYNSGSFFDPANLGDKLIKDEIAIGLHLVAS